jgi:hypothetical protein
MSPSAFSAYLCGARAIRNAARVEVGGPMHGMSGLYGALAGSGGL